MRILVLTPSLPWPPIWGFGTRVLQLTKHLAGTHDVTLLTYQAPGEEEKLRAVSKVCDVATVPSPSGGKRKEQIASLFSPTSFQRRALVTKAMQAKLDELLSRRSFDVVQVESSQMCGFRFGGTVQVILDEHNIEYELLHRMYQTERNPVRRFYNWVEYRKFRREEQRAWKESSGVLFTSKREAEIACHLLPKLSTTAPNGVDIDYFAPQSTRIDRNAIVFTGLMRYRPNIDAAIHFTRTTLPLILQERPHAIFQIVGAGPTDELQRLAGPNVEITGTVDDVRPYIGSAAVVVVPLRMGSGTRLKVLEALSMAKPVVSTSLGSEGIDVCDGKHLLIRDTPAEMAAGILRSMDDPQLAQHLGESGRQLVEEKYSWTSIGRQVEAFHARVLESSGRLTSLHPR